MTDERGHSRRLAGLVARRAAPAEGGLHQALAAQPAAVCELQGQPARLLVVLDLHGPVRAQPVRGADRQRQADPRLLQGRAALPGLCRLSGREIRRLPGADRLPRPGHFQGDPGERLAHLGTDPLLVQHAQPRPSRARARTADLDAHRRSSASRSRSAQAARAATTSNGTGSAPTTRAATWSRD